MSKTCQAPSTGNRSLAFDHCLTMEWLYRLAPPGCRAYPIDLTQGLQGHLPPSQTALLIEGNGITESRCPSDSRAISAEYAVIRREDEAFLSRAVLPLALRLLTSSPLSPLAAHQQKAGQEQGIKSQNGRSHKSLHQHAKLDLNRWRQSLLDEERWRSAE